jgi:hypothetical protein
MRTHSQEENSDQEICQERAIVVRDRVAITTEALELDDLYATHEPDSAVGDDLNIRHSASKLFGALIQHSTCGPEVEVLEVKLGEGKLPEEENTAPPRLTAEKTIEAQHKKLVARSEQILEDQIPRIAQIRKGVIYVLPYRYAGVWHCVLRSVDSLRIFSASQDGKWKVFDLCLSVYSVYLS